MWQRRVWNYFTKEIWRVEIEQFSRFKIWFLRFLRMLFLSLKGFVEDRCLLFSSSLSFSTLLSLVPVLAAMFSVSKGLGLQSFLEKLVLEKVTGGMEELLNQFLTYIENTNASTLGTIGVIFAFLIAVRIISLVERIFNEIWGVKEGRAWWKKMSEYITLIIVTPIFLSGAITLTITLQHTSFFQRFFSSMTTNRHFLIFTSYFSAWLIFSFLYFFLPNTRVRIKSAFLAGVIGGSLWQLAQWGYFHYQVGFTRYNAIYGSFAQVLLFLIWMQVSWAILLLGGEISYVHQNLKILEKEIRFRNLSFSDKEILSLAILADLGKKYAEGKEWSPEEWELSAKVPLRPINQLLSLLEEKGFVKKSEKGQFLPARPYEHIPVKEVIDSLREEGDSIPINEGLHYLQELQKNYLQKGWEKFSSLTLKDILDG